MLLLLCQLVGAQVGNGCEKLAPGSTVRAPREIRSTAGTLTASLRLQSDLDAHGIRHYCYISESLLVSPTLRVTAGEVLILRLKNDLPRSVSAPPMHLHGKPGAASVCDGRSVTSTSTNIHFHGLSIAPICHADDTINTVIEPSDPPFEYRFRIPPEHPPGLYWYHPHPHGFSEEQIIGGASGALIIEPRGDQREGSVLTDRVLILRDQVSPGGGKDTDFSLNYVPIVRPYYLPAQLDVPSDRTELWRILNASADRYYDLQILINSGGDRRGKTDLGFPQTFTVVAIDGVPTLSRAFKKQRLLLPPGARAEIVVHTPPLGSSGQLITLKYDAGPDGDENSRRVIANIHSVSGFRQTTNDANLVPREGPPIMPRPDRTRTFYFSEDLRNKNHPLYFITAEGSTPKIFDMRSRDADVTVKSGTIEDWVIENRAREAHAFHIHQLHFQLIARDGRPVMEPALRDTVDLPFWDGRSAFPSVKLRMDFRNPSIIGTFLFHCHILEHGDAGMMGTVKVIL